MLHQLNQQTPMRVERREDGALLVHSVFHTIQGEGPYAGRAAFFVRLAGCNLQCPGCDTVYVEGALGLMSCDGLLDLVRQERPHPGLIVITGGEPFRQNITPAVNGLILMGYRVQIETNGVLAPEPDFPWNKVTVVVSPKTGKIHARVAIRAHAWKYVLRAGNVASDGLPLQALDHPLGNYAHVARPPTAYRGPIYLQPMDAQDPAENAANVQAVVESVMQHPRYIMGVQMHKITGLP